MRQAALMIRKDVVARWKAFSAGLQRVGFHVRPLEFEPTDKDLLIIWNRHRHNAQAKKFEAAGAKVIVAENGWLRQGDGLGTTALCLSHHNGAGTWYEGPEDRWSKLGIELKPWRADGGHILVLVQRGIGESGVAQPRDWVNNALARLRRKTERRIVVRNHPGNAEPPPEPDWTDCWAAVTWASGAGIKSIVNGIPVFYDLEKWIGGAAGRFGVDEIEHPFLGDRLPMLRSLAYAQWTLQEIESGEPFSALLTQSFRQNLMAEV